MDPVSLCNSGHINYTDAKCAPGVYWLRFSTFPGGDGLIIQSSDGFKIVFAGEQRVKFREGDKELELFAKDGMLL